MSGELVVTLPAGREADAEDVARDARRRGATMLELRTDLHDPGTLARSLDRLKEQLPLLVAERGDPLPAEWRRAASRVDVELSRAPSRGPIDASLVSFHAPTPLPPERALLAWAHVEVAPGTWVKHVEPLGDPDGFPRLAKTRAMLQRRFGDGRVTVLCTGPLASPFRAVLAERNALDYVALDETFRAAPGQRLLDDATRARRAPTETTRFGILGHQIGASRSPRVHHPPYDRIDLPPLDQATFDALVSALRPHYAGFSITSPFKQLAASFVGSALPAVNTLVRTPDGFVGHNTDVAGARAVLDALGSREVTVLGEGGATAALRIAAEERGVTLRVLRRSGTFSEPERGAIVWTWPAFVAAPIGLRFEDARVALVVYGAPARALSREVRARGGEPLHLGPRWFCAQARLQRELWSNARGAS